MKKIILAALFILTFVFVIGCTVQTPSENKIENLSEETSRVEQCTIFEDNFDISDNWSFSDMNGEPVELGKEWVIIDENGNKVLKGAGHNWANAGDEAWTDYVFKAKIKFSKGGVHVNFRKKAADRYFLGITETGVYLNEQFNQGKEIAELAKSEEAVDLDKWHSLAIVVNNDNTQIFLDEILLINYTDKNPREAGAIAFETLEDSIVYIDDVRISSCFEETPVSKCLDSDEKDYYLSGSVKTLDKVYQDQCSIDGKDLTEWFCESGEAQKETYYCPSSKCISGACIKGEYEEKCQGPYFLDGPADFVPDITHEGDLIVDEDMVIENKKYLQQGNIYINNKAKLVIKNSQLAIGRGNIPTIHIYFFVSEGSSLEIDNSMVFPAPLKTESSGMGSLVIVRDYGDVNIINSPTSIHLIEVYENAKLNLVNSAMVYTIGGLLQTVGGDTKIINSTLGGVHLAVPANSHLNLEGLRSGNYLESWKVQDIIPEADYTLAMEKTCIFKDDFRGMLKYGPYERGWQFALDQEAKAKLSNSELRKVFLTLNNEEAQFKDLRMDQPSSLNYRDIILKDVIMKGEWPFTIINSNVTLTNAEYLFLQPTGNSNLKLIGSHIVEFIPRDFFGTLEFENGLWNTAGEIIGGQEYHSMANNFTIKGSVKLGKELRDSLQWRDATVTREYEVLAKKGMVIKIEGNNIAADENGKAKFSLVFNEFNYNKPKKLEVFEENNLIAQKEIDFFTETPIDVTK